MDSKAIDTKIDAAAEKAKELTAKLGAARSEVVRKLDEAIATAHAAAVQSASKSEHRVGEEVEKYAHRIQEMVTKLANHAKEVADELSQRAHTVASQKQHSPETPSEAGKAPKS